MREPRIEQLLRARDVARILQCSSRHVYALIAAGALPSVKIGDKSVRVSRVDLASFIASRSSGLST